jgi:hypothetical protein
MEQEQIVELVLIILYRMTYKETIGFKYHTS